MHEFFLVEMIDVVLDAIMFVLTLGEGDLDFANDPDKIIWWALLVSVAGSFVCFVSEKLVGVESVERNLRYLVCAHLVCEDVFQACVYAAVAGSQAQGGVSFPAATIGACVQAVLFAVLKVYQLSKTTTPAVGAQPGYGGATGPREGVPPQRATKAAAGGIDALVAAMRSHGGDVVVQQKCAGALCNLTISEQHRGLVAAARGIDALVAAMRSHGGDVVVQCAVALMRRAR